jgi:hypothetical protein
LGRLSAGARPDGQLVATWTSPNINAPWGNMATIDNGTTASLFVSMSGFDVPGPEVKDPATGYPVTVKKATVLRIDLSIAEGKPPVITGQTVIADSLGQRADKFVFLIGPTGLTLGADGTLFVSDALSNQIIAMADAAKRRTAKAGSRGEQECISAAGNGDGAQRKPHRSEWQERSGSGDRPGDRRNAWRAVDQRQSGAISSRQRQPVRDRHETRWEQLLCVGRCEYKEAVR